MKTLNEYRHLLVLVDLLSQKYSGILHKLSNQSQLSDKETRIVSLVNEIQELHAKQKRSLSELSQPI
jgi:hypothetical protein